MTSLSLVNGTNLLKLLECFRMVSGLKMNLGKSKLFGVRIGEEEVHDWERTMECGSGTLPFTYLGLLNTTLGPGDRKTKKKLAAWKSRLISIGRRQTLVKALLGSVSLYYFTSFRASASVLRELERVRCNFFWGGGRGNDESVNHEVHWVKWNKVVRPFGMGRSGGGGFSVRKMGCGKSLYGNDDGLEGDNGSRGRAISSVWVTIAKTGRDIDSAGVLFSGRHEKELVQNFGMTVGRIALLDSTFLSRLRKFRLGIGVSLKVILGYGSWRKEPRGREVGELEELVRVLEGKEPKRGGGDRTWNHLDKSVEGVDDENKYADGRVGRVGRGAGKAWETSNSFGFDKFGVDLDSTLCLRCGCEVESTKHALLECKHLTLLWQQIGSWWNINMASITSLVDLFEKAKYCCNSGIGLKRRETTMSCVLYLIWQNRNHLVFDNGNGKMEDNFYEIQMRCFDWVIHRDKDLAMDWAAWLSDPFVALIGCGKCNIRSSRCICASDSIVGLHQSFKQVEQLLCWDNIGVTIVAESVQMPRSFDAAAARQQRCGGWLPPETFTYCNDATEMKQRWCSGLGKAGVIRSAQNLGYHTTEGVGLCDPTDMVILSVANRSSDPIGGSPIRDDPIGAAAAAGITPAAANVAGRTPSDLLFSPFPVICCSAVTSPLSFPLQTIDENPNRRDRRRDRRPKSPLPSPPLSRLQSIAFTPAPRLLLA
ncbi:LOW QUALITY PROTEIN: hypothetical protein OSB04_un000670 [Centaurea solstitialis]|uniref:Reverse transcriptase zinc-binding domain-containing protein n=1 Tax=Centaurea solstitialis TaxID=347529 RepID=A0AA38VRM2_9ASTR|nr:LOW QUALITY PROTEIN: hypothetical protein OSB04_un000670 [Centaurea solstitialis]